MRIARGSDALAVLVGGGIAATSDMLYACIANSMRAGKTWTWTMQSVGTGWLGEASFDGGTASAALGLVSHFAILLVAAWIYVRAGRRAPVLRTRALACGALFGVLVYLFMNFVVLKLSAFPYTLNYTIARLAEGFASHAFFVGVPIAFASRLAGVQGVAGEGVRAA